MRCPLCATEDTRVIDSRPAEGGGAIRRRRECLVCGERFTTFERPVISASVVKRDGRREVFDREKVRRGLESALADRLVPEGTIDGIVMRIEASARGGSALVTSDELGKAVLAELRDLDEVAYLRFASVYKGFQGARDFEREAAALEWGA
ncbi:MAG: transcriptional regulator NrdR, partial [Actinomycetota bacterium]|nr:transcriptional regulator NrdR [Actinomycetota bacterium]